MPRSRSILGAVALVCATAAARAHEQPSTASRLEELVVEAESPHPTATADEIPAQDLELRPHSTMQEVLNAVPGLIVRQHQGGAKAAQYLVRGFNADHGTDFLVTVDGLPVNLPTHGHGQGYADANFVIPETIDRLELLKGPYFPQLGDFATAGALNVITRDAFPSSFVLAEGGSFDRQRYVAGVSPTLGAARLLLATQASYGNGPFDNPDRLARYNGFAKLTLAPTAESELRLSATAYQADWDASGQIPQRLVSAGVLDRFGSLDPTEGGRSDRENLDLHWGWTPTPDDRLAVQLYGSRYKLRLWSDFTFFQDSGLRFVDRTGARFLPGDGIAQDDFRWLYGGRASWTRTWQLGGRPLATEVGVETRSDQIHVALHRAVRRERFFTASRTAATVRTVSGYWSQQVFLTDTLRLEGGLRGDVFGFDVADRLPRRQGPDPDFAAFRIDGRVRDGIVSPKASLVWTARPTTELYLNGGTGFHSNDARGVVQARNDPASVPLARALGGEAGARTRLLDGLDAAAALWLIDLESEAVFCGDCGTVERPTPGSFAAQGRSRRWGVDLDARWRPLTWLTADYDLSWADPRFANGDAIPIAPTLFMNGGLTAALPRGFSAGFRVRFLDDRPATEDRTLTARGYLIMDLLARWRWRNVEASLALLNLGDVDWQEAVFADTSCTRAEARRGRCPSRPDIHFTPGDPFGVRAGLALHF